MRIPVSAREKTAYIQLRRREYTINAIAHAFGRSTNIIHKVLARAKDYGTFLLRNNDLRKIRRRVRELHARFSPRTLARFIHLWENWVLGEEGEPP
jgi:dihydroxyacid dehydratase/phosphogluconate dehydratase